MGSSLAHLAFGVQAGMLTALPIQAMPISEALQLHIITTFLLNEEDFFNRRFVSYATQYTADRLHVHLEDPSFPCDLTKLKMNELSWHTYSNLQPTPISSEEQSHCCTFGSMYLVVTPLSTSNLFSLEGWQGERELCVA